MGSLWTDRQKIPDPEHPIPPDPPQHEDPFRRGPRHVPRAISMLLLIILIAAVLVIVGVVTRVIVL